MFTKNGKIVLTISTIAIIAGATAVCFLWNMPHKNVKDAAAVEVTAADLYNIFITDSGKARALYVDKVVKLSGQIEKISVNQQAQQVILIKTAMKDGYINCTMEEKALDAKEHSTISIKGICSGYISGDVDMGLPGDVFLTRSYLLK